MDLVEFEEHHDALYNITGQSYARVPSNSPLVSANDLPRTQLRPPLSNDYQLGCTGHAAHVDSGSGIERKHATELLSAPHLRNTVRQPIFDGHREVAKQAAVAVRTTKSIYSREEQMSYLYAASARCDALHTYTIHDSLELRNVGRCRVIDGHCQLELCDVPTSHKDLVSRCREMSDAGDLLRVVRDLSFPRVPTGRCSLRFLSHRLLEVGLGDGTFLLQCLLTLKQARRILWQQRAHAQYMLLEEHGALFLRDLALEYASADDTLRSACGDRRDVTTLRRYVHCYCYPRHLWELRQLRAPGTQRLVERVEQLAGVSDDLSETYLRLMNDADMIDALAALPRTREPSRAEWAHMRRNAPAELERMLELAVQQTQSGRGAEDISVYAVPSTLFHTFCMDNASALRPHREQLMRLARATRLVYVRCVDECAENTEWAVRDPFEAVHVQAVPPSYAQLEVFLTAAKLPPYLTSLRAYLRAEYPDSDVTEAEPSAVVAWKDETHRHLFAETSGLEHLETPLGNDLGTLRCYNLVREGHVLGLRTPEQAACLLGPVRCLYFAPDYVKVAVSGRLYVVDNRRRNVSVGTKLHAYVRALMRATPRGAAGYATNVGRRQLSFHHSVKEEEVVVPRAGTLCRVFCMHAWHDAAETRHELGRVYARLGPFVIDGGGFVYTTAAGLMTGVPHMFDTTRYACLDAGAAPFHGRRENVLADCAVLSESSGSELYNMNGELRVQLAANVPDGSPLGAIRLSGRRDVVRASISRFLRRRPRHPEPLLRIARRIRELLVSAPAMLGESSSCDALVEATEWNVSAATVHATFDDGKFSWVAGTAHPPTPWTGATQIYVANRPPHRFVNSTSNETPFPLCDRSEDGWEELKRSVGACDDELRCVLTALGMGDGCARARLLAMLGAIKLLCAEHRPRTLVVRATSAAWRAQLVAVLKVQPLVSRDSVVHDLRSSDPKSLTISPYPLLRTTGDLEGETGWLLRPMPTEQDVQEMERFVIFHGDALFDQGGAAFQMS